MTQTRININGPVGSGSFGTQVLASPPANVSVSGKVLTQSGRVIYEAVISVTDSVGQIRMSRTNQFGYYRFEDIEAGNIYIFNVSSKTYSFETQIINISESLTHLNFLASP